MNVSVPLVSGKTLGSVATVMNTASVERDYKMLNIFTYIKFCWMQFKEDYKNTKKDMFGE
jgi:hypothetical protein